MLADLLSDDQLDEIVMHEQAHLERRDDWLKLLQAIVNSVAGSSALRFIMRQTDADCEAACDDRVVARTGDARRYAWTLAAAASTTVETGRVGLCPSAQDGIGITATCRRTTDPRRDRKRRRRDVDERDQRNGSGNGGCCALKDTDRFFVEAAEAMLPPLVPQSRSCLT